MRELTRSSPASSASNPHVGGIVYDWNEPGMVLKIDVDQNRARQLGVSSQDIATMLNNVVGGSSVTQMLRQHLPDQCRGARRPRRAQSRSRPSRACSSPAATASRCRCPPSPRSQYELEQPLVWRRDRQPTITLQAGVVGDLQPATIVEQLKPAVAKFTAALPPNYSIAVGGAVEESAKGEGRSPTSCR